MTKASTRYFVSRSATWKAQVRTPNAVTKAVCSTSATGRRNSCQLACPTTMDATAMTPMENTNACATPPTAEKGKTHDGIRTLRTSPELSTTEVVAADSAWEK